MLTFDKQVHDSQWVIRDYFPSAAMLDSRLPTPTEILQGLGGNGLIEILPIPHDCTDGFGHAYWQRPEAYLDPDVRQGISSLARLPVEVVVAGTQTLRDDLASGRWLSRHSEIMTKSSIDAGFRLVVAH